MNNNYQVWKTAELSQKYLSGVRSAIPLAIEEIEIILRIIQMARPQINSKHSAVSYQLSAMIY
ncbi:hypothetical protein [Dapis sp. BLCC M172]|uniref:hypothetical protein n=1 Tax=Dapis sp. BLCC M172 TaxID=2975281 RepID=UPI003CF3856E